ncbi:MAG TPA: preprotein translocase subunit SecG [Alphaproteobacteria bacterium]
MEIVLLVIQIFVALAIIGVILIQPPENIGLGGMGSSNPMAGVSARGQGSGLTRTTAVLATIFMTISLVLAIMSGMNRGAVGTSILDAASTETVAPQSSLEEAKDAAKATPDAKTPAPEEAPAVPLAK